MKYLIEYIDKFIRPLVLILPKMSGYARTLKVKDKDKNNKWMSFLQMMISYQKNVKPRLEDLKNVELNASLVYKKAKQEHTNFRGIIVPEDCIE